MHIYKITCFILFYLDITWNRKSTKLHSSPINLHWIKLACITFSGINEMVFCQSNGLVQICGDWLVHCDCSRDFLQKCSHFTIYSSAIWGNWRVNKFKVTLNMIMCRQHSTSYKVYSRTIFMEKISFDTQAQLLSIQLL